MKLISVNIKNYRSIEESGEFSVNDLTCLVGKNEAGKTAVLKAIEGIKPFKEEAKYDKNRDYPRRHLSKYDERHQNGNAVVCESEWELENKDIAALEEAFGKECFNEKKVKICSYYDRLNTWSVPLNEKKIISNLVASHELTLSEQKIIKDCVTVLEVYQKIKDIEKGDRLLSLKERFASYRGNSATLQAISLLSKGMPKFLYFSNYSRINGALALNHYKSLVQENKEISEGDTLFVDFLSFAGTSIEEIEEMQDYEPLKAKMEAASNDITEQIFQYWSQNQNLEIEIDVREGLSNDSHPFNEGIVIRIRIKNTVHKVTVPFDERSAGFVWFFSFLIYFSQVKNNHGDNLIILLDEPGLSLHAKAQYDLLRYINEKLLPKHQVIYTTHSPFMVPHDRLDVVKTVEDVMKKSDSGRDMPHGTKVNSDFMSTHRDTIFPLQTALGYEISQTLFIGKNVLLVEGPSDIIYLNLMSNKLKGKGKQFLDDKIVICPTGSISKVMPFINLFLSRDGDKNMVVLADYDAKYSQIVENIENKDGVKSLVRISEYCGKESADIEDLFDTAFYLKALKKSGGHAVAKSEIDQSKRITEEIKGAKGEFSHYDVALWLQRNSGELPDDDATLGNFERLFTEINKRFFGA